MAINWLLYTQTPWTNHNISVSFVPDGTKADSFGASVTFAEYDRTYTAAGNFDQVAVTFTPTDGSIPANFISVNDHVYLASTSGFQQYAVTAVAAGVNGVVTLVFQDNLPASASTTLIKGLYTPRSLWQSTFAKAFQRVAKICDINFFFVAEILNPATGLGYDMPTTGQGSANYGDIRLATASGGLSAVDHSLAPSGGGYEIINRHLFLNGINPDLYSINQHDLDISTGVGEVLPGPSVGNSSGPFQGGLWPNDIGALRFLYGNAAATLGGSNISTAYTLTANSTGLASVNDKLAETQDYNSPIYGMGKVAYYKITTPSGYDGVTVSLDSRNIGMLNPYLAVFDNSSPPVLRAFAKGSSFYTLFSDVATLKFPTNAGDVWYLLAMGVNIDDYSYGAFKISAQWSLGSNFGALPSPAPTPLPAVPVGLVATVTKVTEIDLSWTSVPGATGYFVSRTINMPAAVALGNQSSGQGVGPPNFVLDVGNVTTWADNATTIYDDGVLHTPGFAINSFTYGYQVASYNSSGHSTLSTPVLMSIAPGTPTNFTATANHPGGSSTNFGILATWDNMPGANLGYRIDISTTKTFVSYIFKLAPAGQNSWQFNGLFKNTTYYLRVKSRSSIQSSPLSATISCKTLIS